MGQLHSNRQSSGNILQPKPSKRSFAEIFFPARTQSLFDKARGLAFTQFDAAALLAHKWGPASVLNLSYIRWLQKESMLYNAGKQALRHSGKGAMWQNPFALSRPRAAIKVASVWYSAYPLSTITQEHQSILAVLGDKALWEAFEKIGIEALHTGPMKQAGGILGWSNTPSVDGHYDRISNRIEPVFGSMKDYRKMCQVATAHGGIVLDDLVPGHTGKGSDYLLAQMNFKNYPGIYHMVDIAQKDWAWLPKVPEGQDSVNLDLATEQRLKETGYIIGRFQRVIFYEPGVKETNWSVTKEVRGVDGVKRRWVYLHYFKAGQPAINWLDPSFAGMQLVVGDALHSISDLGARGIRLDANGFLGAEISIADMPAWSEGHPLSSVANQLIAGMVRKVGCFTFQELNLSLDDIKATAQYGADLSYDFINRPAYHHALATGDTEFLRLMLRMTLEMGIDPVSLVHALQNHDELTYELMHFWTTHKDDEYTFRGETVKGSQLRHIIRDELLQALVGTSILYNQPFTENGIACTTTSVIAAVLGFTSLEAIDVAGRDRIKKVHLLLAMFNALQPGVFALSGWDLSGAFTLDAKSVADLIKDGDTRWMNRGAYDLMDQNPQAIQSAAGIPKATSLYGSLSQQMKDPQSFALQLQKILEVRAQYAIATSLQIEIPEVTHKGSLIMVHQLKAKEQIQVTLLNFSAEFIEEILHSPYLPVDADVTDMFTGQILGTINRQHCISVTVGSYEGRSLLITLCSSK